jgi:hypothetical protein
VLLGGGVGINVLPFNGAPQAFDEAVVGGTTPAVAADAIVGGQQGLLIGQTRKLPALVGVEDARGWGHAQGIGQGQQEKAHVKRVG